MTTVLDLIADGVPPERIDEIIASTQGGCTGRPGPDDEITGDELDELADLDADE